jgi:hypothetical protein
MDRLTEDGRLHADAASSPCFEQSAAAISLGLWKSEAF